MNWLDETIAEKRRFTLLHKHIGNPPEFNMNYSQPNGLPINDYSKKEELKPSHRIEILMWLAVSIPVAIITVGFVLLHIK